MNISLISLANTQSPDRNYCVQFRELPTSEGEPRRLTFTLFQVCNDTQTAIFSLPEDTYFVDGIDRFRWVRSSTAIAYSTRCFKEICIYDFIYTLRTSKALENPKECYWDNTSCSWKITTDKGEEQFFLSYLNAKAPVTNTWNGIQISLSNICSQQVPPLYKIVLIKPEAYMAVLPNFYCYNPTLIQIDTDGIANIHACDTSRREYRIITCDLKKLESGDRIQCHVNSSVIPNIYTYIVRFDPSKSPRYQTYQKARALGESGIIEYDPIEFFDIHTGELHFTYDRVLQEDDNVVWNQKADKCFFNGYQNGFPDVGEPVFVVLDVMRKQCIEEHKGHAVNPRWNAQGTNVQFDKLELATPIKTQQQEKQLRIEEELKKRAERKEEEARLEADEQKRRALDNQKTSQSKPIPADAKLDVCAIEDPEKPGTYLVGITDIDHKTVYMTLTPYRLSSKSALKRHRSIVCFHCTVPNLTASIIVRFDLQDLYTKNELSLLVWDLHKKASDFVWDNSESRWYPIINGETIHPARFYYDDLFKNNIPIQKSEKGRSVFNIIFDLFRR